MCAALRQLVVLKVLMEIQPTASLASRMLAVEAADGLARSGLSVFDLAAGEASLVCSAMPPDSRG